MGNGKRKQTSDDEQEHSGSESEFLSKKTTKKAVQPTEGSSKPKLTVKKPKIGSTDDGLSSSPSRDKPSQPAVKVFKNAEGDKYVDLGKKKRAMVREFKGQVFVDIREFYGADGDEKPGKKGISLQLEQWEALKKSITTIDTLFAEHGKK